MAPNAICTLVVATCGRHHLLLECLRSIPPQEHPYFRILVIDQNETPFLEADLSGLAQQMDLEHIRVPFRNASRARNHGATLATTEWIAFPDDDCRFLPDTLALARERFAQNNLDLLTGQLVDELERPHIIAWPSVETELTLDTFERCLAEGTMFLRKKVFDSVHGFDPSFGPGALFPSAEGAEMLLRLWRTGIPLRGRYTPAIRFFHPDKDTGNSPQINARVEQFAFGEAAFTLRHLGILPRYPIVRRLAKIVLGIILGRGLPRPRCIAYLRGFIRGTLAYTFKTSSKQYHPAVETTDAH